MSARLRVPLFTLAELDAIEVRMMARSDDDARLIVRLVEDVRFLSTASAGQPSVSGSPL